jgi:hypothetical protein
MPFAAHCYNVSWRTTARKGVLEHFVMSAAVLEIDFAMSYAVKAKDAVQVRNFTTVLMFRFCSGSVLTDFDVI